MPDETIEGQLNLVERRLLTEAIIGAKEKPRVLLEVGTWYGGGSTLHILRALQQNGVGHLWGIEANRSVYERMLANLRVAAPDACQRFTALFGFSDEVIPRWLAERGPQVSVDFAFLDGGNNPAEQIAEFQLLAPHIPAGGQLMAHDAFYRKGKWLVPYVSRLDNWQVRLLEGSEVGLLHARKVAVQPSLASRRAARALLFKMRCNPVEIAAAVLPSRICGWVLGCMPQRWSRRLAEGCK